VFFLLVVEIIPPTSLVVPLLGKYLIFAMILVSIRYERTPFTYILHRSLHSPRVVANLQNRCKEHSGKLLLGLVSKFVLVFGSRQKRCSNYFSFQSYLCVWI
jgi:hypothetical protein